MSGDTQEKRPMMDSTPVPLISSEASQSEPAPQSLNSLLALAKWTHAAYLFIRSYIGQACFTLESLDNDSLESKFHKQLIFKS